MKVQLGQNVRLVLSRAPGVVIGAATYLEHGPQVLVRHVDGRGDQVERWYDESAVDPNPTAADVNRVMSRVG